MFVKFCVAVVLVKLSIVYAFIADEVSLPMSGMNFGKNGRTAAWKVAGSGRPSSQRHS
jgi:hypothetical protein